MWTGNVKRSWLGTLHAQRIVPVPDPENPDTETKMIWVKINEVMLKQIIEETRSGARQITKLTEKIGRLKARLGLLGQRKTDGEPVVREDDEISHVAGKFGDAPPYAGFLPAPLKE